MLPVSFLTVAKAWRFPYIDLTFCNGARAVPNSVDGEKAVTGDKRSYVIGQTEMAARALEPALYLVATPIGNLSDITLRALETLASADVVACEDTRVSRVLLDRYGIRRRTTAYHEHNAAEAGPKLIEALRAGQSVALISDAGTPLVSDPGYRLVGEALDQGFRVIPIPGPSAALAALTAPACRRTPSCSPASCLRKRVSG